MPRLTPRVTALDRYRMPRPVAPTFSRRALLALASLAAACLAWGLPFLMREPPPNWGCRQDEPPGMPGLRAEYQGPLVLFSLALVVVLIVLVLRCARPIAAIEGRRAPGRLRTVALTLSAAWALTLVLVPALARVHLTVAYVPWVFLVTPLALLALAGGVIVGALRSTTVVGVHRTWRGLEALCWLVGWLALPGAAAQVLIQGHGPTIC